MIHELVYRREMERDFHVRGYIEEGTTTTPFDMVVCNEMSRFHLAIAALHHIGRFKSLSGSFIEKVESKLKEHKEYIHKHGEDLPEITELPTFALFGEMNQKQVYRNKSRLKVH